VFQLTGTGSRTAYASQKRAVPPKHKNVTGSGSGQVHALGFVEPTPDPVGFDHRGAVTLAVFTLDFQRKAA